MARVWLLLIFVACSPSAEGEDHAARRYNVSLDVRGEERWSHVLQDHDIAELRWSYHMLFRMLEEVWSRPLLLVLADVYFDLFVPETYAAEMRGIAKAMKISTSEVLVMNLIYESWGCTSIVVEDQSGNIYHGRNMDWFHPELLKRLTIDVDFIKNGQVAYTGSTFVGFIGLWTGQRPHRFTVSANAREHNSSVMKNLLSLIFGGHPVSWLIRDTLSDAPDYRSAVSRLSTTPIVAEIYLTVAGVGSGEGATITRNRRGVANVVHLNASYGTWFLAQFNHDMWLEPPEYDERWNISDQVLTATGQENITTDTLYTVLSIPFVLNRNTVHTTMMSAASPDIYTSTIRVRENSGPGSDGRG